MPPSPSGDQLAQLEDGDPGPLYWVCGKERFLVDRAVDLIKARVLDPRTRDFNYDSLYAKETTPPKLIGLARMVPMMSKRRLIVVRDADAWDAKELDQLSAYCALPIDETCIVFVADKVDQRMKFFTAFKKRGVLLKLDPLPERALPGFVRDEMRRRKLRVAPDAAEMIVTEVGAELGSLVDAIERLELYVTADQGRREVLAADVEAVVSSTRTRSVFELSDAIGEGDAGRALNALGSLLRAREPGLKILAMIGRQVRLLLHARQLLDDKTPRGAMAGALALPPFIADKLADQARRFDAAQLVTMHAAIHRTDLLLKSSKLEDARWLELLVLELVSRRKKARA